MGGGVGLGRALWLFPQKDGLDLKQRSCDPRGDREKGSCVLSLGSDRVPFLLHGVLVSLSEGWMSCSRVGEAF